MTDPERRSLTPGCHRIYLLMEWNVLVWIWQIVQKDLEPLAVLASTHRWSGNCALSQCVGVCVRVQYVPHVISIYIYIHLTSIYTCIHVPTPADRKAPSTSPLWVLKETKTWNTAKWEVCPMVRAVRLWCTTALSQQAKIGIPIDWHTFCRKQENSFGLYTIRMPTRRLVSFFLPPSLSYKKQIYIYIRVYIYIYIYMCTIMHKSLGGTKNSYACVFLVEYVPQTSEPQHLECCNLWWYVRDVPQHSPSKPRLEVRLAYIL